jgi:hypothetical protein
MRGRFATLAHDRAPRPSSGCYHRHRHRHASCYINMLGKNGHQTLQLSPSSQSSLTCFSRHHRVGQDGPLQPSRLDPHGLQALVPPVLPCTTLEGARTTCSCWKGVATRHSLVAAWCCPTLATHVSPCVRSHFGGWDHMSSSLPPPSQSSMSNQVPTWGPLISRRNAWLSIAGTFSGSSGTSL